MPTITITINTCRQCRFLGHSGAFTKGGAKPVCEHTEAVDIVTRLKGLSRRGDDRYHWKYRVPKDTENTTPEWCPLLHGGCY